MSDDLIASLIFLFYAGVMSSLAIYIRVFCDIESSDENIFTMCLDVNDRQERMEFEDDRG